MADIEIRPLTTLAQMQEVEKLEKTIWDIDDLEVMPMHSLHAIQYNGGPLFGAYDGSKMVAFALGVLGTIQSRERINQPAAERLKLYSAMAGVLPEYQNKGIGFQLKMAQREFALGIGLDRITWTYDPLESLNGRFNISKLGVTCHTYLRHFHGEMTGLNAGLPTDRFEVEWRIASDRVKACISGVNRAPSRQTCLNQGAVLVNEAAFNVDDHPVPPLKPRPYSGDHLLVEIPADFQVIKKEAFELALRWRESSRRLFESVFANSFTVTNFVTDRDENGRQRSYYLLTRLDSLEI